MVRDSEHGRGNGKAAVVHRLAWVPDALTWSRLLAVPVLWAVAVLGLPRVLAMGTAAAALTDVLDGFAARRLGVDSRRGGALDSAADHLLSASLAIWLAMHAPGFFREQQVPLLTWAGFALLVLAAGWIRFRQLGNLHLYSAKAASVAAYTFAILLLLTGGYSPGLFAAVMLLLWVAAVESLLVILTRRDVRDHGGSILLRGKRPDGSPPSSADQAGAG